MLTGTAIMALDSLQKDFKLTDFDVLSAVLQKRDIEFRVHGDEKARSIVINTDSSDGEEIVEVYFDHKGQLTALEVVR